ncbi:hypothetical protein [Streptomyces sp. NPDC001070]
MAPPQGGRATLNGPDGLPVLTYVEGVRDGRPRADLAEAVGPDPVPSVLAGMPGWAVSGSVELGGELVRHGARVMRHAHTMQRDLVADPPMPEWSSSLLPDGLHPPSCDREARELFPALRAALPPGTPTTTPGATTRPSTPCSSRCWRARYSDRSCRAASWPSTRPIAWSLGSWSPIATAFRG